MFQKQYEVLHKQVLMYRTV